MKINTHKLLLFLYFSRDRKILVNNELVADLFPHLSGGGARSLLHVLKKKQVIASAMQEGKPGIVLTTYGQAMLQKKFPFLVAQEVHQEPLTRSYHGIIMIRPSEADPHFRQLKKVMARYRVMNLQRGVYILQGEVPQELVTLCQEKYFLSILFFELGKWHIPNAELYFSTLYNYSDVDKALSGIGKELDTLIVKKNQISALNHQQKLLLFSVFDQIFLQLWENAGLFFTQPALFAQVVKLLHQLFSCI